MAENIFTNNGGHVRYVPDKVNSDTNAPYQFTFEDQVLNLGLQRDQIAANILANDLLLDALDATIDDQMKDFALTVPELQEAALNLCGSPTVNWECYKKAKELLRIAPWIAYGYDPVQLTFSDTFTPRVGNVVFNCKNFDPNAFHDIDDVGKAVDGTLGVGAGLNPSDVQKKAQANQKKWALLLLFWDLLWGKPTVKTNVNADKAKEQSIDEMNAQIVTLKDQAAHEPDTTKAKNLNDKADDLAKTIAQANNLPNTVMLDRPLHASQLQWEGKSGPIENLLKTPTETRSDGLKFANVDPANDPFPWHDDAEAIWLDFASLVSAKDYYIEKSIPAITSGFILAILEGFCSLIPKIAFYFIKFRAMMLRKIKIFKKIPFGLGRPIYEIIKGFINIVCALPVALNTIFIEICIWLAMMPTIYATRISDTEKLSEIPNKVTTSMVAEDTVAGFISLDCFTSAQEIVNRVNQEATNG